MLPTRRKRRLIGGLTRRKNGLVQRLPPCRSVQAEVFWVKDGY